MGEFRLLGRLGHGGFGVVYLGRSPSGSLVAVKVANAHYSDDPDFRERFRREVAAVRQVSGWFTAALVAADASAARPWLATEFIAAPTLEDVVEACGPLPPPAVWWIARGIAEALVSIHQADLLHRDLKPGNVLIAADGLRVIDFGIARIGDTSRYTRPGVSVGTPSYMPPEQLDLYRVGRPGDVYGLAATVLFAATGHPPHSGSAADIFHGFHLKKPPDLGGLAAELHTLVSRCLSHSPERRMSPAEVLATARRQVRAPDGTGAAAELPRRVLDHVRAHARRVTPEEAPALGPNGTVPLSGQEPTRRLRRPWRRRVEGWMPSAPLVTGDALYVSSSGGGVYALDAVGGGPRWHEPLGGGRVSPPCPCGDVILVGAGRRLLALDRATGQEHWAADLDGHVEARPAAADGIAYACTTEGVLHAVDAGSGKSLWRYPTGGGAASAPTVASGAVYVGDGTGRLHALRSVTGELLWRCGTGGSVEAAPAWHDGSLYAGSTDRCVHALDATSGTVRWRHHTGGPVRSSPTAFGDTVYAGSSDGGLYALDAATGGVRWRYRTGGAIQCSPAVTTGTVYTGSLDTHVYALDAQSGAVRWRFRTGGWIAATPAAGNGLVYVGSYDKHVYALDALSGGGPPGGR